jgi:uncharacterized SAM-binding protein YcdF (DUF218 family)
MDGIIITLGAPNDENGALSSIAKERCEQAIIEYWNHPTYKILPTGGYGPHFNTTDRPHAFYTTRYLVSRGVPKEDILEHAESANTIQDARLAKPIVEKHGVKRVIVVTSDFHLQRAKYVFQGAFPGIEIAFSACPTDLLPSALRALRQHEQEALSRLLDQNEALEVERNDV